MAAWSPAGPRVRGTEPTSIAFSSETRTGSIPEDEPGEKVAHLLLERQFQLAFGHALLAGFMARSIIMQR
jgi:hypothetical protein